MKAFHKLMPATFIVPSDDTNFPPNTWGIKLGKIAHNIKVIMPFGWVILVI